MKLTPGTRRDAASAFDNNGVDPMKIELPPDRPHVELPARDGGVVTLSPLTRADRALIEEGFAELSIETRYARFGQGVAGLSGRELDYLSDVDQHSHVAWGAVLDGEVAGVGRYIVPEPGDCAEFAITVIDVHQRRGVGTALFQALAAIARDDGVHELCFEAQPDNEAVMGIMREMELATFVVGGTVGGRIRLEDIPSGPADEALVRVMSSVRS